MSLSAEPRVVELTSVPGWIVFDLPGAAHSAGGTRLAPGVSTREVALLARAMTYKFAALNAKMGGAKAGIAADPADRATRASLMARYCAEIAPLAAREEFLTGPDMGTFEQDFAPLRAQRAAPSAISAVVDGMPFEDLLTGFGVAVAAGAALAHAGGSNGDGWAGRSVAIEGLGKVGGGVALEVVRRGGRVVAVSTIEGCVADPVGLDVPRLLELRREHGDRSVREYGGEVWPAGRLFTVPADVVVPGTRTGIVGTAMATGLAAEVQVVAPAANAPYTARGASVLRERGILALPDFVCNAGAVIAYRSARDATSVQVLADVERRITALIGEALSRPEGPLAGACASAADFLRSWWGEPPPPPFAPEG
jgi:glutamate dehydrogenase (NAD(P)+)